MKVIIKRANGDVIEVRGSREECEAVLAAERAPQPAFVPYIAPTYPWWNVPAYPQWMYTTSKITVDAPVVTTATVLPSSGRYQ